MKNTIKALSKQSFGAKYKSARKSLLAAAILFIAIYAAEIRVVADEDNRIFPLLFPR